MVLFLYLRPSWVSYTLSIVLIAVDEEGVGGKTLTMKVFISIYNCFAAEDLCVQNVLPPTLFISIFFYYTIYNV